MAEPIRILVVDDEPDFIESVRFWLTSKGYQVDSASNGPEAIAQIKDHPPSVVFLDVKMPQVDGIETLRRIRAFDKQVPVILVTASNDEQNRLAGAKALGISGVFPKEGTFEQLVAALDVALRHLSSSGPGIVSRWFDRLRAMFHRTPPTR